jgi:hypothetical protein
MGPESEGVLFGFGFYFKGDAMFWNYIALIVVQLC